MAWEDVLDAINGKRVRHHGISGKIKVERFMGRTKVWHEPDASGKRTKSYQEMRRQLRDDWSTDLTASDPEVLVQVAGKALGGLEKLDKLAKR